jgi:hypothetical protein
MRYTERMTAREKESLSRGFDAGNYGNAYESQDWEAWRKRLSGKSTYYRAGATLGFFSSYELDEINDLDVRERVAHLRSIHDYDACAKCGASINDDYLRANSYVTRVRDCERAGQEHRGDS